MIRGALEDHSIRGGAPRLWRSVMMRRLILGAAVGAVVACGGCATGLPTIRPDMFAKRFAPLPRDAAPVFSWRGERKGLFTYWGRQDVNAVVRAYFPCLPRTTDDACWEVAVRNGEGKYIPYLGIIRSYRSETGATLSVVVPPIELSAVPDGLYVALLPEVTREGGEVRAIVVTAVLCEIRDHLWKPFRVRIPMVPQGVSTLTPAPPLLPEKPRGTPIPFKR